MDHQVMEDYKPMFLAHGVTESYFDSWFSTYETENAEQESQLEAIKKAHQDKRPVILLGKFGTGKTHLAMAMVKNYLADRRSARYYTLASLFRAYRETFSPKAMSESRFFQMLSELLILVIDEINIKSDSEAENRFFQEVMDIRYSNGLPTVLIGNLTPAEFSDIVGERIIDRLKEQGAEVVVFNWKSRRGK